MLYDEVIYSLDVIIDNYLNESTIKKFQDILDEKRLDDPDYNKYDFKEDFSDICSEIGFYYDDYFLTVIDTTMSYYDECVTFIEKHNYYSGWKYIADEINGGQPFVSIRDLVCCILLNGFYEDGGVELLAGKIYDVITS